jgi:putative sporulation protein YtxC
VHCQFSPALGGFDAGPADLEALFRRRLADAVTDVITHEMQEDTLTRLVAEHCSYLDEEEQTQVRTRAEELLLLTGGMDELVGSRLRDYLTDETHLNLEGFIFFRLREYAEELEDAVDRAVDDFLMEREYREFIRLLKVFVEVQEPRLTHVHVVLDPGGGFRLIDDQGGVIHDEHLEGFVADLMDTEINYDDLLISTLITLAPARITIHRAGGPRRDALDTIQGVFNDRVELCGGCSRCAELRRTAWAGRAEKT